MQAADASFIYEPEPCRGASDSNGNWYPLMPTLEEQNRFRRLEINRHWNKYQKGQYKKSTGRLASSVYMFKPNEIQVFKTHHAYTDEIINIHVSVKDPENRPDVNFFGYNSHEPCIAFRGQACHFSSFFALAHLLAAADKVELFYKSPSEVKFPPEGLQPNLTYEEFAGEIEIVEYVAWLKDGDTQTGEYFLQAIGIPS